MTDDQAMSHDDLMKRAGARWCDVHSRWECTARKAGGCHASAIRGTDKCRHHSGKTTAVAKAQGEANLLAWSTAAAGDAAPLDLGKTVMDQLRVAVLRADLLGERLANQLQSDEEHGLVGEVHTLGREGQRYVTGERARALAGLEAEWRDRAVRFAKTAHDMGIDQRHIELEQAKAEQVIGAVRLGLAALPDLLPAERDAFLRAFLGALGAGEVVAGEVTSA